MKENKRDDKMVRNGENKPKGDEEGKMDGGEREEHKEEWNESGGKMKEKKKRRRREEYWRGVDDR